MAVAGPGYVHSAEALDFPQEPRALVPLADRGVVDVRRRVPRVCAGWQVGHLHACKVAGQTSG